VNPVNFVKLGFAPFSFFRPSVAAPAAVRLFFIRRPVQPPRTASPNQRASAYPVHVAPAHWAIQYPATRDHGKSVRGNAAALLAPRSGRLSTAPPIATFAHPRRPTFRILRLILFDGFGIDLFGYRREALVRIFLFLERLLEEPHCI
jgi:hypothetical protein